MSDPGDKPPRAGERAPLPRTNRPRPSGRRPGSDSRPDADRDEPLPETRREEAAAAEARATEPRPTAKSLDVDAATEAAPPTVREGDRTRASSPALEDGAGLAERPTQLDTGRSVLSSSPRLTPKLKEVPLVRADGTRAVDDAQPASTYVGCIIDDRYRIEGVLGRGGMGVVYRARHDVIDKLVAIKILLPTEDSEVVDRFVTEARAATAIGNAHIVDTVDFGKFPDGSTYFVMEYLEGQTLARRIKTDGFVPIDRALAIGKQIAEGMGAAHRAGIVHRDLKPENIFLIDRDGEADFVKLLDFGIAKVESSQNRITRAGTIFGTPHYMSPEQAAGREVDARADIYATGVILYEMLSGRTPFDAENPMGLITQHLYTEPTPLARLPSPRQEIPSGLDAIVLKCLSKEPGDRYGSMTDLVLDLERFERKEPPEALADLVARAEREDDSVMLAAAKAELRNRPARRGARRFLAGGIAILAAATAAVAAWSLGTPREEPGALPSASPTSEPSSELAVPPTGRAVALVFSPIDGEVFRGDRSLGGMPVTVHIGDHEVVTVEIRREGFYPETVRIDGSRPVVVVRLSPIPAVQPRVPVPTGEPLDVLRKSLDAGARAHAPAAAVHHDGGAPAPRAPAHAADGGAPHAAPRASAPAPAGSVPSVAPEPTAVTPPVQPEKPPPADLAPHPEVPQAAPPPAASGTIAP